MQNTEEKEIIDFHIHLFPERIAKAALKKLCAQIPIPESRLFTDATPINTKEKLLRLGIKRAVVCNIAVTPEREERVNDFAISLLSDGFFVPLGSVHPKSRKKEAEISRLAAHGIKGIKIHPDFMGVKLSDGEYDGVFAPAEDKGLFVLFHSGYNPFSSNEAFSDPEMIASIAERYKSLKIVAAHFGGFGMAESVLSTLVGSNVYLDSSLSAFREDEKERVFEILMRHREDRLLFGSDSPWSDAKAEIDFIKAAPISENTKKKILYENAKNLIE